LIESAEIAEYEGEQKIKLSWSVLQPEEFKGRKVFQNIKVFDSIPEVSAKARKMLAAIDFNAGGKLLESGQTPDDMSLTAALSMKQMVLRLAVWEMNAKAGNWVTSVAAKGTSTPQAAPAPQAAPETQAAPATTAPDSHIPF
jgi:hypothetical protein